jgi:Flp pilus assembly protein TadD
MGKGKLLAGEGKLDEALPLLLKALHGPLSGEEWRVEATVAAIYAQQGATADARNYLQSAYAHAPAGERAGIEALGEELKLR